MILCNLTKNPPCLPAHRASTLARSSTSSIRQGTRLGYYYTSSGAPGAGTPQHPGLAYGPEDPEEELMT